MTEHEPGWAFYKKGVSTNKGKMHFVQRDENRSICGKYNIEEQEFKFMRFLGSKDFAERKQCGLCQRYLQFGYNTYLASSKKA